MNSAELMLQREKLSGRLFSIDTALARLHTGDHDHSVSAAARFERRLCNERNHISRRLAIVNGMILSGKTDSVVADVTSLVSLRKEASEKSKLHPRPKRLQLKARVAKGDVSRCSFLSWVSWFFPLESQRMLLLAADDIQCDLRKMLAHGCTKRHIRWVKFVRCTCLLGSIVLDMTLRWTEKVWRTVAGRPSRPKAGREG